MLNPEYVRILAKDQNHNWYSIPQYRFEEFEKYDIKNPLPEWAFPVPGTCICGKPNCNNAP